jgi:AcrR family transcriptional regulator
MSEAPAWQSRIVDRSLDRTRDAVGRRTLGPSSRIVAAALELIDEKNGTSFTVQQVVDRAGVALQTFYRHFGSKDVLILALVEEVNRVGGEEIRAKTRRIRDPLQRLAAVVKAPILRLLEVRIVGSPIIREHIRLAQIFPDELDAAVAPYRLVLMEAIEAAAGAGAIFPVDVRHDTEIILHLVLNHYHGSVLGVTHRDPVTEADYIWEFCLAALGRGN